MNFSIEAVVIANFVYSLALTIILLPLIIVVLVELRSFNKSTHKIEYVPAINNVDPFERPERIFDEKFMDGGITLSKKEQEDIQKFMHDDDGFIDDRGF